MNNTAKNDLFGFPKVKWLQYTGNNNNNNNPICKAPECQKTSVGKCTSYQFQIFSGFNIPKNH